MSESPVPATPIAPDEPPLAAAGSTLPPAAGSTPRPAGARAYAAGLWAVAVIAVAAVGLTAWQVYSNRQDIDGLRQELARRLAEVDTQTKTSRLTGEQLREATREASVKIGVLEGKLAESQSQQIALEALYQELSRNRDEWAFAEIEQTLLLASQQLQLAGNVRAALIALQAADARLQYMNRPPLLALRKAINEDIARLNAAPFVDTTGLAMRIDSVIAALDKLPLAAETRPAPEVVTMPAAGGAHSDAAWSRFWREVWTDLRQMVRVQRIENADVPLLAPAQAFFLRENLKLRLLTARVALLTRDQATYRGDLAAARAWLSRYFDARDKAVALAASALASLQSSEVTMELPDLSATLGALRTAAQAAPRVKQ